MSTVKYDRVGQEVREGDLIYIVVTRYQSKDDQIGRVIKINDRIHYVSKTTLGGVRKNVAPTHFCVIPSTKLTKPIEEELDKFYADWITKHKDFQ